MADLAKPNILAIVGPTASGKTALSVEAAKRLGGEIISADSMQVYKGMDIATAKPDLAERQGIKHHLFDFLEVEESFSVATFIKLCEEAIEAIRSNNKIPIIAGGTGLYVDSLLSGTRFCEGEVDFELRETLMKKAEEEGLDSLLAELKEIDTESYQRLKEGRNPKRIVRAIEIFRTTGITMTEQNRLSLPSESPYNYVKIGLDFKDRQNLYDRINLRVDKMLDMGLLREAKEFYSAKGSNTAVQAIGYKELKPYLDGEEPLDVCIESLKRATRRYAKRQLTWFRRDENTKWFYADEYKTYSDLLSDVFSFLCEKGFDVI